MHHHERITDPEFRKAVDMIDAGDLASLQTALAENPDLARRRTKLGTDDYFDEPSLLEFIAENPVRHGKISKNIAEIATAIIDAGAHEDSINSTLSLVSSGRIVRECELQQPLIHLLCEHGADPDSAMLAALGHGEFDAIDTLIGCGARTNIAIEAAKGNLDSAGSLVNDAGEDRKHLALALAAQFGHADVVKMLLDASVDPNRYNPDGAHAHSTPLHQATLAGHFEVVKVLVEHGADTNIPDTIHNSTARGWAEHGGDTRIIELLESIENNKSGQSKS